VKSEPLFLNEIAEKLSLKKIHEIESVGDKPIQSSEMILAIKEYEEFDDLKIDLEDMEQVFHKEFGSKILKST